MKSAASAGELAASVLALVATLTGCAKAPESPSPIDKPPPTPAAEPVGITGFKFLDLGMTLEQLTRFRGEGFDGERHMLCVREEQAMWCRLQGMTIAEQDAVVEAMFLAPDPVVPLERVTVPAQYHPSWQEIRLGNEAQEEAKTRQSQRDRERIMRENHERELKHRAQFKLARITITADGAYTAAIEQALQDRYRAPIHLDNFRVWDSPAGKIVMDAGLETTVSYTYHPLDEDSERYFENARQKRAGDL